MSSEPKQSFDVSDWVTPEPTGIDIPPTPGPVHFEVTSASAQPVQVTVVASTPAPVAPNLNEVRAIVAEHQAAEAIAHAQAELEIVTLLDQLAEVEAARDLTQMDLTRRVQAVALPAEIATLKDTYAKETAAINDSQMRETDRLNRSLAEELAGIAAPPEIAQALAELDRRREAVRAEYGRQIAAAGAAADAKRKRLLEGYFEKVSQAEKAVTEQKQSIVDELDPQLQAARKQVDVLTEAIKAKTCAFKASVKGTYRQAIFTRGKVTWTTETLDALIDNPETPPMLVGLLESARKVGKPSCRIDTVKGNK